MRKALENKIVNKSLRKSFFVFRGLVTAFLRTNRRLQLQNAETFLDLKKCISSFR